MEKRSIIILKLLLFIVSLFIFVISAFGLPIIADEAATSFPEVAYLRLPVLLGIYASLIPFYISVYSAWKILNAVKEDNLFSQATLKQLSIIRVCAYVIISAYMGGIILLNLNQAATPPIILLGYLIIVISLGVAVTTVIGQSVLRKMIAMKIDQDLTI